MNTTMHLTLISFTDAAAFVPHDGPDGYVLFDEDIRNGAKIGGERFPRAVVITISDHDASGQPVPNLLATVSWNDDLMGRDALNNPTPAPRRPDGTLVRHNVELSVPGTHDIGPYRLVVE